MALLFICTSILKKRRGTYVAVKLTGGSRRKGAPDEDRPNSERSGASLLRTLKLTVRRAAQITTVSLAL